MNKSESREIAKLIALAPHLAPGTLALALSGLARATRTKRSRESILAIAIALPGVANHPDFIV